MPSSSIESNRTATGSTSTSTATPGRSDTDWSLITSSRKLTGEELSQLNIDKLYDSLESARANANNPKLNKEYRKTNEGLIPVLEKQLEAELSHQAHMSGQVEQLVTSGNPLQNLPDSPVTSAAGVHKGVPEADLSTLPAGSRKNSTSDGAPFGVPADWAPPSPAEYYSQYNYDPNGFSTGYSPAEEALPRGRGGRILWGTVPIPEDASLSYSAYVDYQNKLELFNQATDKQTELGLMSLEDATSEKHFKKFTLAVSTGLLDVSSAVTGRAGMQEETPMWVDTPDGRMFFTSHNRIFTAGDNGDVFAPLAYGPFVKWANTAIGRQQDAQHAADRAENYKNNPGALEAHLDKIHEQATQLLSQLEPYQESLRTGYFQAGANTTNTSSGNAVGQALTDSDRSYFTQVVNDWGYQLNKMIGELQGDSARSTQHYIPQRWSNILGLGDSDIDFGYIPYGFQHSPYGGTDPYAVRDVLRQFIIPPR